MATYYKYAERSADSQINWSEVGKNMSDMLLEENRIREQKKASIDAASRRYGEVLANSPMGEHRTAREATLKFADDAANYMRIQDQLLKSGQMKLRDYTIARQNLLDGTNNAFTAMKEFQDDYGELMERAKTNKSALLELRSMEQVQKFGNWSKSGFYINPTDGNVNVAMMTEKDINGKKVYTMDDKPGEFASVNFVRGLIKTRFNRYDPNVAADGFVNAMGKQIEAVQKSLANLKSQGLIENITDIRNKKTIDPVTNQIIYNIDMAENQAVQAALANDYDRASLLTDSKKTASNGKLYDFTDNSKEAAANPNLILKTYDPNTGQIALKFTDKQIQESDEYMKTEFRRRYDYEKEIKITPQTEPLPQPRERSPYEIANQKEIADARNFAENLSMALTGRDEAAVKNAVKYLANKAGKSVTKDGSVFTVSNTDGTNATTFDLQGDPKKLAKSIVSAFGTTLPEDKISQFTIGFMGANPFETQFKASGFNVPPPRKKPIDTFNAAITADFNNPTVVNSLSTIKDDSEFRDELNNTLGSALGLKFESTVFGKNVYIPSQEGRKESPEFPVGSPEVNRKTLRSIENWIKSNYLKGKTLKEKEAEANLFLSTKSKAGELD
jgi:hypothetical protein